MKYNAKSGYFFKVKRISRQKALIFRHGPNWYSVPWIHQVSELEKINGTAQDTVYSISLLEQHGRHFADNIFKSICLTENISISNQKFIPKGSTDNKSSLVEVMAWYRWNELLAGPILPKIYNPIWHH